MAALAASPRSTSSRVAMAAAQATGLPPNVEPWPPGSQSMTSARATMPASGSPLARPLPMHMMSGSHDLRRSLARPHPAGAPDAGLHLVDHEQDAVVVAQRPELGQPPGGRDDVAALALDRLDEDGGHVGGIGERVNSTSSMYAAPVRASASYGSAVRGVERAGRDDAEAGPLAGLAGGQREAAERAPVEGAEEGDHVGPPGVVAGQLERRLDGLGAGVGEEATPAGRGIGARRASRSHTSA